MYSMQYLLEIAPFFCMCVGIAVGRRSGGQLTLSLVGTISVIIVTTPTQPQLNLT